MTKGIAELLPNDTVQRINAWDPYKYSRSGTFIDAGTSITPFYQYSSSESLNVIAL
ncbi:hypothetical protein [Galbibacter sp.]|uniref:hypothetical protein n=1 Tax=Galbibacter sp. TaxID=2918471 RepID=UPI003A90A6FC